jgi:ribosomal protein L27
LFDETYIADSAVSAFRAVVYSSVLDHVKLPTAQDANGIAGVTQHSSAASGDTIIVRKAGRTKVQAGVTTTIGQDLRIYDLDGNVSNQAAAWASGDGILGVCEEAATASGDIITAWLEIHTAH